MTEKSILIPTTEEQEERVREKAWDLIENIYKLLREFEDSSEAFNCLRSAYTYILTCVMYKAEMSESDLIAVLDDDWICAIKSFQRLKTEEIEGLGNVKTDS